VKYNIYHGFRHDPRHSSEILWMSASSTEELSKEKKNSLFVDRAPCYDGLCTSSPKEKDAMGEATLRLGGPSVGPTVWSEFGRMASANSSIANLGQGFPDWLPPKFALDSLVEAVMDGAQSPHQYTRTAGHPNLVRQLAKRYSSHFNREIDPMAEVAVTVGASQALYLALQTHIKPGKD
jgi:DNA-binding transcriptional MocR family regulator